MARDAAALQALRRGQALAARGERAEARRWLDYAFARAPDDAEIGMALGSALLLERLPRAVDVLRAACAADGAPELHLGFAAALRLFGQAGEAAAVAAATLRRHAPLAESQELLTALARETGAAGWCGLTGDGQLTVGLAEEVSRAARRLHLTLDNTGLAVGRRGADGLLHPHLPKGWRQARVLHATLGGRDLLGSPLDIRAIIRTEGFVAPAEGGLAGWAWLPGDPAANPELRIARAAAPDVILRRVIADDLQVRIPHPSPLARPRGFSVSAAELAGLDGLLELSGPDGTRLYGSPVDPGLERRSARAAARHANPAPGPEAGLKLVPLPGVPADLRGAAAAGTPDPDRPFDVVIPVYAGQAVSLACIASVLAGLPAGCGVIVVDDASPEPALVAELQELARAGRITLLRHARNRGFPATANAGMRAALAAGHDIVLLNSDTLVPPGALARLRAAAHAAPDIGTVTPFSNDATILSYPDQGGGNALPDLAGSIELDALAARENAGQAVEIPTAIGFCMYVRQDCLRDVGPLREDIFGQGYGEENDFCLRARHLGWRHLAATDAFVAHIGGQSFGGARTHLITRNLRVLERLHPGYGALIQGWIGRDPLAPARRRLDAARWLAASSGEEAVLLITHGRAGGVKRRVAERAAALAAAGKRPILLTPAAQAGGACVVDAAEHPNLRFALPAELAELGALLGAARTVAAELHHFIGHAPDIAGLPAALGIPCDVVLHDYAWFCPRITLFGAPGPGLAPRYCGEPELAGCEACIADLGSALEEEITPAALRARSAATLAAARSVIAPSADAARRMRRHFPGIAPLVQPWEDDPPAPPPPPARGEGWRRVAVAGAIGQEKGYEVLLACARDAAARRLGLEFVLVGYSSDDLRLLQTGRVQITGRYAEAVPALRAAAADIGFLPSLWPETWSYTLGEMWQAGLRVLAFDLGAPAERLRATGGGWLVPANAPPAAINDMLLRVERERGR